MTDTRSSAGSADELADHLDAAAGTRSDGDAHLMACAAEMLRDIKRLRALVEVAKSIESERNALRAAIEEENEEMIALKDEVEGLRHPAQGAPTPRCEVCDWPLAESREKGCVPGDCSYRPDDPAEQRRISERRTQLRQQRQAARKERTSLDVEEAMTLDDLPHSSADSVPVAYLHQCRDSVAEPQLGFEVARNPQWTSEPLYRAVPQAPATPELVNELADVAEAHFQPAVDLLRELYEWCRGCNDFRVDSNLARRVQNTLRGLAVTRPHQRGGE